MGLLLRLQILVMQFLSFDRANGGFCIALWPHVLSLSFPILAGLSLDKMLMKLIERSVANWEANSNDVLLDCVEICAGAGQLSKELIRAAFRVASFDIVYEECHDFKAKRFDLVWCPLQQLGNPLPQR